MTSHADSELASLRAQLAAAEARAAELDEWLEATLENSPTAMGVISARENRYVRVNRALEELLGRSRNEILQVDPFSFTLRVTHPDDLVADQAEFARLVTGEVRSYELEKRFIRPDGSYRWTVLRVGGAYDPEPLPGMQVGALRFVSIRIEDITDRRATAEALKKSELELRHAQRIEGIGRLAGGVAHDFNNLLTVIAGHGELLRELVGDGSGMVPARDVGENLEAILAAADRAASLTAQLLAHGRRERVMPRAFALSDAVGAMQRLLVRIIGSSIETETRLDADGQIFADQGQIGQVVMNLVLNARDAMPDGGRLTLCTRDIVSPEAPAMVALVVSDSGHGMSPEVQARMFEPFFTTRDDRPGTQGTGLGLATVQRIVAEAGGHIAVESVPGLGTAVTVTFPRVAGAPKADTAPARGRAYTPNAERLLVVEDDGAVRALVASVLVGAHYRVTAARNGEEALRFIDDESVPFDLVVTDLMMARVGGAALARKLAERGAMPPMLFISGYSDHTPADLAPYGELLPKPFTPSQLLEAVRRTLDQKVEG